ncbi:hypothetical protein ADK64_31670 [Streptomyces sp. MMG1121]|nr:hypothetical protein ADK64_31670 [Streptomyces sp. MMG1121]
MLEGRGRHLDSGLGAVQCVRDVAERVDVRVAGYEGVQAAIVAVACRKWRGPSKARGKRSASCTT